MGLPRIVVLISSALLVGAPALAQLPPAYLGSWGGSGSGAGQFSAPYGIAIGPDGRAYVLDSGNQRVELFTAAGDYLSQWSRDASADHAGPIAIAVAPNGDVYILTGPYPGLIHHHSSTGVLIDAEQSQQECNYNAYGISATPGGCILEPVAGSCGIPGYNLYYYAHVRNFSPCAGEWGGVGSGPGQFSLDLRGVAVDAGGNVYVVDYGNKRIEKFNASGAFLTQWGSAGAGDGQFTYPFAIAVGPNGQCLRDGYRVESHPRI